MYAYTIKTILLNILYPSKFRERSLTRTIWDHEAQVNAQSNYKIPQCDCARGPQKARKRTPRPRAYRCLVYFEDRVFWGLAHAEAVNFLALRSFSTSRWAPKKRGGRGITSIFWRRIWKTVNPRVTAIAHDSNARDALSPQKLQKIKWRNVANSYFRINMQWMTLLLTKTQCKTL